MSDKTPTSKPISLDALLAANKAQFDKMFEQQTGQNGLVGISRHPATDEDLVSASLQRAEVNSDDDIDNLLAGRTWSSEIVEHKIERNTVTVMVKLTVDSRSKMQFGTARVNGNEGKALQRATPKA